jgi:hypothetical protein
MKETPLPDSIVSVTALTIGFVRPNESHSPVFVSAISSNDFGKLMPARDRSVTLDPRWRAALRRRVLWLVIGAAAALPLGQTLLHAFSTSRNVAYWDEIDSVLPLLLQLKSGLSLEQFFGQLFAVTNEHRTVTSRLIYAISYWLTGTVDFAWIGAVGNAFIVAGCGLLVALQRGVTRRLQLAVILAFMVFHLGHYESFLWSGSSIDHFQVVALAIASFAALGSRTPFGVGIACVCGFLATFTLAHGLVVWPVGGAVLARDRRWRELVPWVATAAFAALIFFSGFQWNAGHRIATSGLATIPLVAGYWLKVLGAPLAFGHAVIAMTLGAVLVLATALQTVLGNWTRQRTLLSVRWFLIGAALLIASGRAEFSHGEVYSRYLIVGSIAWSLLLFDGMNRWRRRGHRLVAMAGAVVLLAVYNHAQNVRYAGDAATFVEHRDRAALRYRQFGEDGKAPLTLHPDPRHATRLLAAAEQHRVYRMPPLCEQRQFAGAKVSDRLNYYVDECTLNSRAAYIAGWVTLKDEPLERGDIHVILRSAETSAVFTAVPVRRADVVKAYGNEDWEWSGFRFAILRDRLPPGDYQIGFLVAGEDPVFVMSQHRLNLMGEGAVLFSKSE